MGRGEHPGGSLEGARGPVAGSVSGGGGEGTRDREGKASPEAGAFHKQGKPVTAGTGSPAPVTRKLPRNLSLRPCLKMDMALLSPLLRLEVALAPAAPRRDVQAPESSGLWSSRRPGKCTGALAPRYPSQLFLGSPEGAYTHLQPDELVLGERLGSPCSPPSERPCTASPALTADPGHHLFAAAWPWVNPAARGHRALCSVGIIWHLLPTGWRLVLAVLCIWEPFLPLIGT